MGIIEIGVNIGNHNLISVKYYSQEDVQKSKLLKSFSDLRYDFIAAIDDIAKNLFGKELSVVSLSEYRLIYISESVKDPYEPENDLPLICYSITDNNHNNTEWTKKILKEILSLFLNRYSLYTICSPGEIDFQQFEPRIHKVVGDLRYKVEDTFQDIFRS